MPTYDTRDFEHALEKVGYRRDKTHHNMFWYFDGEHKTSLRSRTSQGEKEYGEAMLSQRRKQIGPLTKQQFLDLVKGLMSPEEYRQHLIDANVIEADE